jgi:glycerophosphoryl diester phosphodiesterase
MTIAVAHRGEPRGCTENTLPALLRAIEHGADAIEVDVRCTEDGVAVVHHDETLSRLWRHPAALAAMTAQQLRRHAPQVPTLGEALDSLSVAGVPLVIDVGSVPAALASYRVALEAGALPGAAGSRREYVEEGLRTPRPADRVWFCGAPAALAALRELDAGAALMLTWDGWPQPRARVLEALRPTFYNPWHRWLGGRVIDNWHQCGVRVCTWTVDDPGRRRKLIRWGVDAIISNDVAATVADVAPRPDDPVPA